MTHKEYIKILLDIKNDEIGYEEKIEQLNRMYEIKPVSLLWNVVKAEIMLENGEEASEVYKLLDTYIDMDCETEGNIEGNGLLRCLDNEAGDLTMGRYRDYETAQCRKDLKFLEMRREKEQAAEQDYLNNGDIENLLDEYLASCKVVSYYVLEKYNMYKTGENSCRRWVEEIPNIGFLKEAIDKRKDFILCVDREDRYTEIYILGSILAEMGSSVSIVNYPVSVEADGPVKMEDAAAVSLDNITNEGKMRVIPAIELIYEGKSLGNNVAEIVRQLTMKTGECRHSVLLAANYYIEQLASTDFGKKHLQNLYLQTAEWKMNHISFAWAGSYLSYISDIYSMDAEAAIHKKPGCRFSVIVPVRNFSATLPYTLDTCINQRYQGDYEIIVSDNSSEGNTEIYEMVQEIDDEHIRYIRPPRELNLTKSFEYAFLRADGEYIFAIGADDGLLPWTLEVLEDIVDRYQEAEVLHWDRGFYAWPGFNGGQENQFCVPKRYQKGKYNEGVFSTASYLEMSLEKPKYMYIMPLLYINSMFKRSYFDTLLAHTGRLWDGRSQDIYTGVVTSLILPWIVSIAYPLSIAGMSPNSIGSTSNKGMTKQTESEKWHQNKYVTENIGGVTMSQIEMLLPDRLTDVGLLYSSILRAVARGVLSENVLGEIDWKVWFLNYYNSMNKRDMYFSLKMQKFRFAAMKHGEEFLKWFDANIYEDALEPVIFEEKDKTIKTYEEYDNENGIMLDASKYGVKNIYEASLLFERLTGL